MKNGEAINRQTKQRLILSEDAAFELDKRQWRLGTAIEGGEKEAINKETPSLVRTHFAAPGIKCLVCGSYVYTGTTCNRDLHVRFNDLRR